MLSFLKVVGYIVAYVLVSLGLFWVFVGPAAFTFAWNQPREEYEAAQLTCNLISLGQFTVLAGIV